MTSVAAAWMRIDRWLARDAQLVAESLGKPLSASALDGSADLPAELVASLKAHDGQRGELPFFEGYSLMSLAECLAIHSSMLELRADFEDEYRALGVVYWGDAWFPLMDDRAGSFLCVDGDSHHVVQFLHDQPDRSIVAPSLAVLLNAIADTMDAGECVAESVGVRLRDERHALWRALWG